MTKRTEILKDLAQRIGCIEGACHSQAGPPLALGIPALEEILPGRRLPAGALIEFLSAAAGAGSWTLALIIAREACGAHKALVVADRERCFYPPAAAQLGVDLNRLLVMRPEGRRDLLAVVDLALRCRGVGSTIGWFDQLSALDFRRLQLAAEMGGGLGLVLRPRAALAVPSFARLRLLVTPVASSEPARRLRIDVIRCQGGRTGQELFLEVDDETGDVRAPAGLAPAAAGA